MVYDGIDEDRRFITRSAEEMALYLSSDVLLWRMTGQNNPLCPGNLLLAQARLSFIPGDSDETFIGTIKNLIQSRATAWEKKVDRELPMRVNQWQGLVEDFHRNNGIDATYPYNVRVRVILDLLMNETRFVDPSTTMKIELADDLLGRMVKKGEFVWDRELSMVFPQGTYTYLYYEQAGKR